MAQIGQNWPSRVTKSANIGRLSGPKLTKIDPLAAPEWTKIDGFGAPVSTKMGQCYVDFTEVIVKPFLIFGDFVGR